jgi:hypothetical protein
VTRLRFLLSDAGAPHTSPNRLPLFRAPHGFGQLGARLGRHLQEPQQQRIEAPRYLIVVASLIAHKGGAYVMPADTQNPDDNPYELIGRAIVLWNRIETFWHLIFIALLNCPRDQADAIYLTLANFKPQRDIGRALAKVVLSDQTATLEKVLNLETNIGNQVGRRNAFVHSRYIGSTSNFKAILTLTKQ